MLSKCKIWGIIIAIFYIYVYSLNIFVFLIENMLIMVAWPTGLTCQELLTHWLGKYFTGIAPFIRDIWR